MEQAAQTEMTKMHFSRNLEHNVTRNLSSKLKVVTSSPLVNLIVLVFGKSLENILKVMASGGKDSHVKVLPLNWEEVTLLLHLQICTNMRKCKYGNMQKLIFLPPI